MDRDLNDSRLSDKSASDPHFDAICTLILKRAVKLIQGYGVLHLIFASLFAMIALGVALTALFTMSGEWMALWMALLFCVSFFFFVLRIYYQAQMPEQLGQLRDEFIVSCRELIDYRDEARCYLEIARMLEELAAEAQGLEHFIWPLPRWLESAFDRLSLWMGSWHWKEVLILREMLLIASIDEYIKLVQSDPINVKVHAHLARAYVGLARLFKNESRSERDHVRVATPSGNSQEGVVLLSRRQQLFKPKFLRAARCAVEEFKIIRELAPNDPWVHAQLASSYGDLQMRSEEIAQYERLLQICPDDDDSRFRLGMLYFQEAANAQGLKMYQHLVESGYPRAHQLLSFYDAWRIEENFDDLF